MSATKQANALSLAIFLMLIPCLVFGNITVKLEKVAESQDFIDLEIFWIPQFTVDQQDIKTAGIGRFNYAKLINDRSFVGRRLANEPLVSIFNRQWKNHKGL